MTPETVEALLSRAREARERADGATVLSRLDEACAAARALGDDHPLVQVTAWRLAKAAYDYGAPARMLDGLRVVLALEDPFEHYPAGLQAVDRIARAWWDRVGYGEPLVVSLWEAAGRAWTRQGDPYLAASAEVNKAWQLACRGDREALRGMLVRVGDLTPRTFGDGPHRHPRAPDAPASVYWVQMDLARTSLWCACWLRDERLGREALELLEDAAEEAGLEREREAWYLDPAVRSALTFGWPVPGAHRRAWLEVLHALRHPRRDLHHALATGVVQRESGAPGEALRAFEAAAAAAIRTEAGPEWAVDALVEGHRTGAGGSDLLARARERAERYAVSAFTEALSADPPTAASPSGRAAPPNAAR